MESRLCSCLFRTYRFQEFEAPIFQDNRYMVGKVVSSKYRLRLPPRKYSWFLFLLEAE